MSQGNCNNHGLVEAVWKEGTSKAGRNYAFWACPRNEKDADGNWLKCKVDMPNNSEGKFDQDLDRSKSQMDGSKKDELITRTAIAKSLIEAGQYTPDFTTLQIAENWLEWCQGKKPHVQPQTGVTSDSVAYDDVSVEDIPF